MPNGTSTAVTEATRLTDIGFPEFTAKLVKDVFDVLLGATLHQMGAYSELVAATAKTLQEYVAENKHLVSGEEVWDWLVKNLPGPAASVTDPKPEDATLVRVGVSFDPSKDAEKAQLQKIHEKVGYPDPMPTSSVTLDEGAVNAITDKVREIIAGNRYTLLKEMVKMGIIRLVVDYGEIETRLTFTTYGESLAQRTANTFNTKAFAATANLQTGKAINKWVKVSAAANYTSVSVRTTSSIDRDVSGSKVDIYARVFIRFKSDYLALGG
jgi:tRNA/tmRNA/rRNA uracil-C5-methylase (TrmA/RlmC/RlmD family)